MQIKNGYEGTINVRPYCALIPEVKNFLPDTKNGAVPQDSNIVITFNKPMNKENFKFSENISIMLNGLNKTDYFSEPELSEEPDHKGKNPQQLHDHYMPLDFWWTDRSPC